MRKALAERLKEGLTEGIEHARGERTLVTSIIDAPPGRDYNGEQVAAIRKRHGLSQAAFARVLMVSVKNAPELGAGCPTSEPSDHAPPSGV